MAIVGRLAGAIVAETRGTYYLVGNPKVPCDFAAMGFETPAQEIDARARPFIRLCPRRAIELFPPVLALDVEGENLPRLIAASFLIERTGSVSERLWRLVIGQTDVGEAPARDVVPARWLGEVPAAIWQIVRDSVLRCS
jgi:hypothetical protein